jgi:zinc protease
MFFLAFQGVKVGEKDAYSLDILSSVLGDGQSSYLHQKYVANTKPLLTNVFASNYTMQESGVFFMGGQLIKGEKRDWIKEKSL